MYISPIFLWSTVVTQSCSTSSQSRRGAACSIPAVTGAWVAIAVSFRTLLQRHQIGCDRVQVAVVEVHRRHQGSGLEVSWIIDEGAKICLVVGHRARGDGVAAGYMRQVRAKSSGCHRSGHSMATDAGVVLEDVAARRDLRIFHRRL